MKPTSSNGRRAWLLVVTGLALGMPPGVAFAQQPQSAMDMAQARALLNDGLKLRKSGDLAGALEKIKAAHALAGTPVTGFELGRSYLAVGQLVEGRELLLSVARIPIRPEETDRSATARSESAKARRGGAPAHPEHHRPNRRSVHGVRGRDDRRGRRARGGPREPAFS